jgi:hypothetical protein
MFDDIYCALSGITPDEDDLFSDIPHGWMRVTVEKQVINPQWAAIQMVKKGLVESTLLQLPEEHRDLQRMTIEIQVAAQFHGYEDQFDQFITISEEVYISDPSKNSDVKEAWDSLAETLGLEEDFVDVDVDVDEEDEEEEKAVEEAPKS